MYQSGDAALHGEVYHRVTFCFIVNSYYTFRDDDNGGKEMDFHEIDILKRKMVQFHPLTKGQVEAIDRKKKIEF